MELEYLFEIKFNTNIVNDFACIKLNPYKCILINGLNINNSPIIGESIYEKDRNSSNCKFV